MIESSGIGKASILGLRAVETLANFVVEWWQSANGLGLAVGMIGSTPGTGKASIVASHKQLEPQLWLNTKQSGCQRTQETHPHDETHA